MNVFVLSLKNSPRRKSVDEILTNGGIEFEFFDAVDGKKEFNPLFENYKQQKRFVRKGYDLLPGEKGCFASHYLLWKKCVELGTPIVVLEDDIEILPSFKHCVSTLLPVCNQFGLIRLHNSGTSVNESPAHRYHVSDLHINDFTKPCLGTQGYIISPEAAKKLMDNAFPFYEAVDDFIDNEWRHRAGVYSLEKHCVTHLVGVESDIGDRKKHLSVYQEKYDVNFTEVMKGSLWLSMLNFSN